MATEDTDATPASETATAAAKAGGGLLKAVGITLGLFVLVLTAQLVSPIIGCKVLGSVTPNCPAPAADATPEGKPAAPKGPPVYLPLDPPLVVSLQDGGTIRFLQVAVEVMARDERVLAAVQSHMPVIRNNLLMLLGGQSVAALTDREAKEQLRQDALAEIRQVLRKNQPPAKGGKGTVELVVEDLYFTSFVVQ